MESIQEPVVLTIAGFDPSAGAGILADIKTYECIGVYGIGIITALTLQTEKKFKSIQWRNVSTIKEEMAFLLKQYPVKYAKIGITRNMEMLQEIIHTLNKKNILIVWDPVLKSSTGKNFFHRKNLLQIKNIIKDIYCVTPNVEEALILSGQTNTIEAGLYLSKHTNVIIKGGHNQEHLGTDVLFLHPKSRSVKILPQTNSLVYPKHGSGCVFSSALTAYLALGYSLRKSAQMAKIYTEHFLASNKTLLGYHFKN